VADLLQNIYFSADQLLQNMNFLQKFGENWNNPIFGILGLLITDLVLFKPPF